VPIRLIAEDERQCCEVSGAKIWYRRVPAHVMQRQEALHTRRGVVEQRAVLEAVLVYAVLDWSGVEDAAGQPVPFQRELIKWLPESAKAEIVGRLYEDEPEREAALGN
jgi:hypothetical protein